MIHITSNQLQLQADFAPLQAQLVLTPFAVARHRVLPFSPDTERKLTQGRLLKAKLARRNAVGEREDSSVRVEGVVW